MSDLASRMVRAARLQPQLYEEVERDTGATGSAMLVVVLSSLAAGLSAVFADGMGSLVGMVLLALVGWYAWALITYLIGTKLFPVPETDADIGQLLRTTGFSSSPGLLRIFGFIPILGPIIMLIASVWMLIAMVIAVRQALDYTSTGRTVLVCLVGWIVQLVILFVGSLLVGGLLVAGSS